jgi:hypothetical protein
LRTTTTVDAQVAKRKRSRIPPKLVVLFLLFFFPQMVIVSWRRPLAATVDLVLQKVGKLDDRKLLVAVATDDQVFEAVMLLLSPSESLHRGWSK